jgi:hypothetical protein
LNGEPLKDAGKEPQQEYENDGVDRRGYQKRHEVHSGLS